MADKRGFSYDVVESDDFYTLPITAQLLYFHMGVRAKNKGICNCAYTLAKALGCPKDDVLTLSCRGYIKPVPDSEFLEWQIVHWYENNGIGETAKKRNNYTYRKWRQAVIGRDKKCVSCGVQDNLQAHHIKSFAKFPLLRFDLSNGITLCEECHKNYHRKEKENGRCQMDKDNN